MKPFVSIPVSENSQAGEARRAAARLAAELDFDESTSGRAALVVTELANNLVRHALQGRLLLGCRTNLPGGSLEVLSLDHGPGMADAAQCIRDGYSTAGTPGTGLGAVRRMSNAFSVHSEPGKGTVIAVRVLAQGDARRATKTKRPAKESAATVASEPCSRFFDYAAVCLAAPGEVVSGDAWALRVDGDRAAVMVVDGLGHGPIAAAAATAATDVFARTVGTPGTTLERAHEALRGTRGAAGAVVDLDAGAETITFAGAGNIAARLVSGVEDRSLLSQHGTLGLRIRRLGDLRYPWPGHALLVLHSDGIASRWQLGTATGLLQCAPAVLAGWLMRDHLRGRDDAIVVVIRRS